MVQVQSNRRLEAGGWTYLNLTSDRRKKHSNKLFVAATGGKLGIYTFYNLPEDKLRHGNCHICTDIVLVTYFSSWVKKTLQCTLE